jgi:DNA-binding LacI/PurR family transcriptional regulator
MTTIKDVAAQAGVSPSTVSRVLADSPRISDETKERVRRVLRELDYHPNAFARSLVTNVAGAMGILIPPGTEFFQNPFFSEMMSGVTEVARSQGFDIVLSTSVNDETEVLERMIRGRRVDGILLLRSRKEDPAIRAVLEYQFPAVLLGRPPEGMPISSVNNENVQAAYEAAKHLVRLGHRKIGFLGGDVSYVVTDDRLRGYRQALVDNGIEPDDRMEVSSYLVEHGGYLGMMRLLAASERPTAVLASDDVLAFGAMRAAGELGYSLPDDMAIVGFNDIRLAELANPALTSVRVNMHDLGVAAADLLVERVKSPMAPPSERIVPTELVIRNSCGARKFPTNMVSV